LKRWLDEKKNRFYFRVNKYVNRNRIVDRVMRRIRDMFDELGLNGKLIDINLMNYVVDRYNHMIILINDLIINLLHCKYKIIVL
jgi:DNA integrity scanning protein DisA with diadenylate cyclase activity